MNFKYKYTLISDLNIALELIKQDYLIEYNLSIGFSFINGEIKFYKSITEFNNLDLSLFSLQDIRKNFQPITVISL